MGMWNSRHGKFKKHDPNHGWLKQWLIDNWKGFWNASLRKDKCCKNPDCRCK